MASAPPRPGTPPHQPTHGVHMPHSTIEAIAKHAFPDSRLNSIEQLATGQSYNNRIYFLHISHPTQRHPPASHETDAVLKVNGRFFGADKVENEVASLVMLEAYCPQVPAPRVHAWSGDGTNATFVSSDTVLEATAASAQTRPHGGWILMSRLPGDPVSALKLDEAAMGDVMRQLADITACWRRTLPSPPYCGNARLRVPDQPRADILAQVRGRRLEILIRGVLMDDLARGDPIRSVEEYLRLRLEKRLDELAHSSVYAPNRAIAPLVRGFLSGGLARLGLDEARAGFVFTHYDLSPRNVLVAGEPPRITGVVDFEFSGFFPPLEELINDCVGNEGDWPETAYDAYLARLEGNGVATPRSVDGEVWDQSLCLEQLVASVAPWWLPGDRTCEQLAEELRRVEQLVRESIRRLQG